MESTLFPPPLYPWMHYQGIRGQKTRKRDRRRMRRRMRRRRINRIILLTLLLPILLLHCIRHDCKRGDGNNDGDHSENDALLFLGYWVFVVFVFRASIYTFLLIGWWQVPIMMWIFKTYLTTTMEGNTGENWNWYGTYQYHHYQNYKANEIISPSWIIFLQFFN